MDGLSLLSEARAAGLVVEAHGDKLVVKGPRRAEAIARQLIDCKAAVLTVLTARTSEQTDTDRHQRRTVEERREPTPACVVQSEKPDYMNIKVREKSYHVRRIRGMWFFQLEGHDEAGWTCCSREFVKMIEESNAIGTH